MPKNLGLYNDDLSTPRKQDVDACYGPNNPPPYPVTSVNGQTGAVTVGAGDIGALPLTGGTMTGALVAKSGGDLTIAQVRNVIISTEEPSAEVGFNGDIWICYME